MAYNRGDPNHLLAGMILQVTVDVRGAEPKNLVKTSEALRADRLEAWTRSSETTVRGGVAGLGRLCVVHSLKLTFLPVKINEWKINHLLGLNIFRTFCC